MIPKVTRGGSSFKGAFQYYLHDKDGDTRERIAWTQTENMRTDDPDKAWRVMAFTAREQNRLKEASGQSRAGRKLEKPVFAYSLAWHPEQEPSAEHMLETARKSIEMLGLTEHEAVIVAHRDEPQKHVHVIVNRVHPITGLAGDVRNSKLKFSDFAREYEREHGKIYCQQREENAKKREEGKKVKYGDPIIVKAWENSHNGQDFVNALEREGYAFAQGRKRPVVIDLHGKAHNPTRHLEGVKAKEFRDHLQDVDFEKLPTVEDVAARRKRAEPELEERKKSFEAVADIHLRSMATKHGSEADRFKLKYSHRIDSEKERMIQHYQLRKQKEAIHQKAEKIRNASWWDHLWKRPQRDQAELKGMVSNFKSSRARYYEHMKGILDKRNQDFAKLRKIQERELSELRTSIERERASQTYSMRVGRAMEQPFRANWKDGASYER